MTSTDDLVLFIINDGKLYERLKAMPVKNYANQALVGLVRYRKQVGSLAITNEELADVAKQLEAYYERDEVKTL